VNTKEFNAAFFVIGAFLACLILVWVATLGCVEVNQTDAPTTVGLSLPTGVEVGEPTPTDPSVDLVFTPPSPVVATAPLQVSVFVEAMRGGAVVPGAQLTVSLDDNPTPPSLVSVSLVEIDQRTVTFKLVAPGTAIATITAAGASEAYHFTVN
jgi:hypothetical protein